jgi:hypothetical protein
MYRIMMEMYQNNLNDEYTKNISKSHTDCAAGLLLNLLSNRKTN